MNDAVAPALAEAADRETAPDGPPIPADLEEQQRILSVDAPRLDAAMKLRQWLLTEGKNRRDTSLFLEGLCEGLNEAGVPVDRGSLALETLHSEHGAIARFWMKGGGVRSEKFRHGREDRSAYEHSPFYYVHQTRKPLLLDLRATPDERFGVVPDLKAGGYVAYLCLPIFFANGDENGIAVATKSANGFSQLDLATIGFVMPAMAVVLEVLAGYRNLDQLLRIYVGDEPRQAILSGSVRRGDVTRIRSAILFADMRNYTRITSALTPEASVDLLNAYFDCLVPPIEAEGGEVL
jgi:adenylate cyclase